MHVVLSKLSRLFVYRSENSLALRGRLFDRKKSQSHRSSTSSGSSDVCLAWKRTSEDVDLDFRESNVDRM